MGDALLSCGVWRLPNGDWRPSTNMSSDCDRLAGSGSGTDVEILRSSLLLLQGFFFDGGGGNSCRPILTGLSDMTGNNFAILQIRIFIQFTRSTNVTIHEKRARYCNYIHQQSIFNNTINPRCMQPKIMIPETITFCGRARYLEIDFGLPYHYNSTNSIHPIVSYAGKKPC